MNNRRLLVIAGLVLLFSIVVLVWYFFYVTPAITPSISQPTNALPVSTFSKGFQFIFGGGPANTYQATSTIDATSSPLQTLTNVWGNPTTGQAFATQQVLVEVFATATQKGTTTPIIVKKTIRATSTLLMFVDRTTGYVYGYDMQDGTMRQITNTTFVGVHDAYIFNNGTRLVARYYDSDRRAIVTTLADIPSVSPNSEPKNLVNMRSLPQNVSSIAINKKGDRVSYLVPNENGSAIYTVTSKGGGLVATSPFSEWSLSYGGDSLYATTLPSAYQIGMTVSVPSFEYRIGNKTGLMSNPSDKGTFLSSVWTNSGLATFLTQTQKEIVLQSPTISSKCAWGTKEYLVCAIPTSLPQGEEGLPDDWFQGRVGFDDALQVVDAATGGEYPLYTFDPALGAMDLTNLVISSDNKSISFIRKQDGGLWLLRTDLIGQ